MMKIHVNLEKVGGMRGAEALLQESVRKAVGAVSQGLRGIIVGELGPAVFGPTSSGHCAEMPENIASCEASIAASSTVIDSMTQILGRREFEVTTSRSIAPAAHREPHPAAKPAIAGLARVATDGERNGRLAWVPGSR